MIDGAVVERVEGERAKRLGRFALDAGRGGGSVVSRGSRERGRRVARARVRESTRSSTWVVGDAICVREWKARARRKSSGVHREIMRLEANSFLGEGARNLGKGFPAFLISIECREDAFEIVHDPSKTSRV